MEKNAKDSGSVLTQLKRELRDEIAPIDLHKPADETASIKPTPVEYVRAYIAEAVDAFIP